MEEKKDWNKEAIITFVNNWLPSLVQDKWFTEDPTVQGMARAMPFISACLAQYGIYVAPVGASWCVSVSKESALDYIRENHDLMLEYGKWCDEQR